MSLDPLAAEFPGWSAYNYVMGNPVSLVDPEGLAPTEPPKPTAPGSYEGQVDFQEVVLSGYWGSVTTQEATGWVWHGGDASNNYEDAGWMMYGEYANKIKEIVIANSQILENWDLFAPWAKSNSKYDPAMPWDLGLDLINGVGAGLAAAYVEASKVLKNPTERSQGIDNMDLEVLLAIDGAWALKGIVKASGKEMTKHMSISTSKKQLQKKFKHAVDFGVSGNFNLANSTLFDQAIQAHANTRGVDRIVGKYRGNPAIHYLNTNTGVNIITNPGGQFISGWKLSKDQIKNLNTHGGLN